MFTFSLEINLCCVREEDELAKFYDAEIPSLQQSLESRGGGGEGGNGKQKNFPSGLSNNKIEILLLITL